MSDALLQSKLVSPPLRSQLLRRPRLLEALNGGLEPGQKLILVSAPAGFGKTTLASEWVATGDHPFAWLSLDENDGDSNRFLQYLVAALQKMKPDMGDMLLHMLQSSQPSPVESILTLLVNEISEISEPFNLVLDDYHVVETRAVDEAILFLLDHMPPQMRLVMTTREDPNLGLPRLRARGHLTELRANDLRFTLSESIDFLNKVMELGLAESDIASLETRTEGWIAGLQLAALSMRGQPDTKRFIESFTGTHQFVLDYLVEEVLDQQATDVQDFLLRTSILDRLHGSLCDAVLLAQPGSSQEMLTNLVQGNLFTIPLDNEREWYRYHPLFTDLLRQRLHRSHQDREQWNVSELHKRASEWYEQNGSYLEAFQHAVTAEDFERAERLIEGDGMPLQFRGMVNPVLHWLESLPASELNARPSLWVTYASALTMTGQLVDSVEEKLQAAETALASREPDETTRDLIGHIAAIRAMLAVPANQLDTIVSQSRRALDFLDRDNLSVRTTTTWTLGYAYQIQGNRAEASQAYEEAIAASQASGNRMVTIAALTCLGQVQESENLLHEADETFRAVLHLSGDPLWPAACEACLGLARLAYEWNEVDTALQYGEQSARLAAMLVNIDTPVASDLLLARARLAKGDISGAQTSLHDAEQFARQNNFIHWLPRIEAVKVMVLLRLERIAEASAIAFAEDLPLSQARVYLAQGETAKALAILEPARAEMEAMRWADEQLRVTVLEAVVLQAHGEHDRAIQTLEDALGMAEPGGFVRVFLDEGVVMESMLREVALRSITSNYVHQLLAAFGTSLLSDPVAQPLADPLTDRELDVLRLLGTQLSGPEIARELMVSLNTVRTHTKNIYSKLGVNSRRAAVQRASEIDLL